ncbi:SigE family RNA polymerase sigma factor [Kineosporia sp. NBRC 101731]|uniref:SigE family RNA polymerase sigma factor n=1 Tax=Kineosporia sp. NBRC 101731 TaxID=3032199 RepID=UPI0024A13991|nr:SigE family RNA polymerase sigma factor [Kineosporia sp. NBRC 101731]GLY31452.1 RNA polymerase subunit sigma-24 [Kineosporia sp. NBRC 101731]
MPAPPDAERDIERPALDFEDFYRQEFARMVTLAIAVSGSRVTAEDVAQDALLQARQKWDVVGRYDKPGAWLRKVTIQLASKRLRRARVEAAALLRLGNTPPEVAPGPDEVETVLAAIRQLPRQQRAAIVLAYLEDRSVKEVAEIMGCAEGTAKAHLHKARARLARILGEPEVGTR